MKKNYRNKFERQVYNALKRARARFAYEAQKIPYVIASHYIPDFRIETTNGLVFVECKGYFRPEDKRKLFCVKRQHPEIDLRIVFYAENKKYIKWCIKNGFRYAIGKVPNEWLCGL
ncbi:MAG TPA: hypothetical protein VFV08_11190 [Puia sp.]|nr:hypothetical protein [Puia sp.]